MPTQVNIHTAKTTLSDLILRAEAGEEVVIARHGKPVVRLTPIKHSGSRAFGAYPALAACGDEALSPLDDDELAAWEG